MQKELDNLELVQDVNFRILDSLKNNATKYLLIIDDSCEDICNAKALVDIGSAGRHRGLNNIYVKLNLFHQSKLERDVEHHNTHIVLFKSPRVVMHVSTTSARTEFRSEVVDWSWDARSVPYGHLYFDLSPQKVDQLRYCTNIGSITLKFFIPDRLN